MDLKKLEATEPWSWGEEARDIILEALRDSGTSQKDLLLATELAAESVVSSNSIAEALLAVLVNPNLAAEVRGQAALSLGPALAEATLYGFEDPDDVSISESCFEKIRETMRHLYVSAEVPKLVRRRILEGSSRAAQDWHRDAIRAAYACDDPEWQLTAVFCMAFVDGFDAQILDAMKSPDEEIRYVAVCAAGEQEIADAWPLIKSILTSPTTDKALLIAAIGAVGGIRAADAIDILDPYFESDDEDIIEAVHETVMLIDAANGPDDLDDFDDLDDL